MRDYKYSLDIMKQELDSPYICPEIKYAFKTSIESLEKQIKKQVVKGNYDEECDSYDLLCPVCKAHIGSLDNEDDGTFKCNLNAAYCPKCGQKIGWEEKTCL